MSGATSGPPATTRREKAVATRRRMRESALALFLENGYAATSMSRVAAHAGVAVQTLHYSFGTKLALLKEILDVSIAGDESPVPTLERAWVGEALHAEPRRQIALQAEAARRIHDRAAPVLLVLRGAATADPDAAELWRTNRDQFRTVQRHLVDALATKSSLRGGLDVDSATDVATTILGVETYTALVVERGWSPASWELWAAELLPDQLLAARTSPPR